MGVDPSPLTEELYHQVLQLETAEDVQQMRDIGVDAILLGETLVKSKDTYQTARNLVHAGRLRH